MQPEINEILIENAQATECEYEEIELQPEVYDNCCKLM